MKKFLVIVVCILFASCSSDDSESNQLNPTDSNSVKFTKLVSFFPLFDGNSELIVSYDSNERIIMTIANNSSPSTSNSTTNTFHYNEENKIWKIVAEGNNNYTREHTYLNGLIISATQIGSSNNTRDDYSYNSLDQLVNKRIYDENEILIEEKTYTYNTEGNISRITKEKNGVTTVYSYLYDNGINPYYYAFNNSGITAIAEHTRNNIIKRTISSNNITTTYTSQYTYYQNNLPITVDEYRDFTLFKQSSYEY